VVVERLQVFLAQGVLVPYIKVSQSDWRLSGMQPVYLSSDAADKFHSQALTTVAHIFESADEMLQDVVVPISITPEVW
jgi:hypothetical protein